LMKKTKFLIVVFTLFANYGFAETPAPSADVVGFKDLYGYKYIKQLPKVEFVKKEMTSREALKILGEYTSAGIPWGGDVYSEGEDIKKGQRGDFNYYSSDESKLRFLKCSVFFYKIIKSPDEKYGEVFPKDSGDWLVEKINYTYYTEEEAKSIYEKEKIEQERAHAAYQERMRKTPKYFKYNYLQNNLYYYALVDQFPEINKLQIGISAEDALKIIGCNAMGTGGDPDKIAKFDDKSLRYDIGGWVFCKREDGKPYFINFDVLFLKKRVDGESYETYGSPFDYFKCKGWYVGGVKVSYPSEASVKEEFEKNNKKSGN